ncbi:citrate transporter [Herbaspirillum sp. HC18]|nr:citrate transporter [Herbaspirillum sp. HC18]
MFGALAICLVLAFVARSVPGTAMAATIGVVPILLILGLLFAQVNMVVAALCGGVMAMIMGGIGIDVANKGLNEAVPKMLSITVPILNSAIAMAVFKAGGYSSALTLVRRSIGGKVEYVGAFIVILQAAATYMSGIGGGSAMVIAPLAFAAVGAIPAVVAGMAIAAAASFTTSPASLESSVVSKLTGVPVVDYVATMQPYWLLFCAIAVVIAFVGTKRAKTLFNGEEPEEFRNMSNGELWKRTIPAIFLLFAVIAGPFINKAVGAPVLAPLVYATITIALVYFCSNFSLNQSVDSMIDGSSYILTRLLQVGIFLVFIGIIEKTGAFATIAGLVNMAPPSVVVPAAIIAGFAIGFPAGAYVGSILTLILPITVAMGFSPLAVGFVTMGVGFGSQVSLVNITMQALSAGFRIPVIQVSKGNAPFIAGCVALLVALSVLFV